MAVDPVCKMQVNENTKIKAVYKGKTYYFCSENCQANFMINPGKYVK
ncbi:MAG: YHS domain-containing protein [Candidatus Aenigmatarchaeota archaeon]